MKNRRQFLGASAALAGAPSLVSAAFSFSQAVASASEPLNVLILGGTGFIGPHEIEQALGRGHRVTTFNRGRRAGMYGDRVEELLGDRDAQKGDGLESLKGERRWDVVLDNSGYVPRHVRDSAELLKGRCGSYVYVSTVAVYDFDKSPSMDRNGPLLAAPEPATERVTGKTYGPLKAECERQLLAVLGDDATIVRPTYIVGPGDTTDRFTYWVERLHRGGDVVCPAFPEHQVQWIDVRDLAKFLIGVGEQGVRGAFNGVGPASKVTNEMCMNAMRAFTAAPTTLWWPDADLVEELNYPTPMFDSGRTDRRADMSAAIQAGLTHRSLADTIRDTHLWWQEQPEQRRAKPRGWPSRETELAMLERIRG